MDLPISNYFESIQYQLYIQSGLMNIHCYVLWKNYKILK